MAASTSEPKPCPQGISVKIPKVARWLQGPEASYFRVDHNLICVNREGLEEVAGDLVKSLLREISVCLTI
ncbi:hypothetical protein RRF57_008748 [Xylaria bambusicola]|uniref:Uncharacterized protein n=1 Tax=Xylaria bambusicola TaxID=326684 RepID=A0AAN7V213_9PEZI